MGHPIRDDALEAKVREHYAQHGSIAGACKAFGIGPNRVRRILGKPVPPSCRPENQQARREAREEAIREEARKELQAEGTTVSIHLTAAAFERLAAIADTAYLSPEAFATTIVASYLSYQPEKIVLEPREPEAGDEEPEEDEPDEEPEEEEEPDEEPEEEEEPEDSGACEEPEEDEPEQRKTPQWDWIKIGVFAILEEDDKRQLVQVKGISTPDLQVRGGGDRVRVKRPGGSLVDVLACELAPRDDE